MFEFIKKLFAKEEEVPKEELKTDQLQEWFSSKTKEIFKELDTEISNTKDKISEIKEKTLTNLETLKTAQLQNPKIPFRAIQMMEGNRDAYIRKIEIFLKQIVIDNEYNKVLEFCNSFGNTLNNLGSNTIKQYQIMQEFFSNESRAVAENIKEFDNQIKELRKNIEEKNISKINEISERVISLNNQIKQKSTLSQDMTDLENSSSKLNNLKETFTKNIQNLKNSEDYSKFNKLKEEKEETQKEFSNNNSRLSQSFSVLETALKKYQRLAFENQKLIEDYLKDPITTILNDKELKIISILEKLSSSAANNEIELKDRKKEKTIEEIKNLTKDFFESFIAKHNNLKNKLLEIKEKIENNQTNKDIEKSQTDLNKTNEDIINCNTKISKTKEELSKINIEEIKKQLEKELNELLKVNLSLD